MYKIILTLLIKVKCLIDFKCMSTVEGYSIPNRLRIVFITHSYLHFCEVVL